MPRGGSCFRAAPAAHKASAGTDRQAPSVICNSRGQLITASAKAESSPLNLLLRGEPLGAFKFNPTAGETVEPPIDSCVHPKVEKNHPEIPQNRFPVTPKYTPSLVPR